ncbi:MULTISPECIES: hypothetical protein [Phytobacter]|nr:MULTISPECIES: hypothetical protein [Phytobacter]MDU4152154.1 hypothetical protein [Enterobacteriaceae bacterium]MDU7379014.1 hypothetical protein [Enterobacteriaceae bacterium]
MTVNYIGIHHPSDADVFNGKDVHMLNKAALIRGWFTIATIFTCFTLGSYIGHYYFAGSRIPWLIGVIAAIVINWGSYGVLKKLT